MWHCVDRSFVFGGYDGVLASLIVLSAAVGKYQHSYRSSTPELHLALMV